MVINPTTQKKDVDLDTLQEVELSVQYVALRKQLNVSEELVAKIKQRYPTATIAHTAARRAASFTDG